MVLERAAGHVAKLTAALALGLMTCSCTEDYLVRRDAVSLQAGDAVRADMARQMIDPWPAASGDTTITSNGERLQHAMERYRNPSSTTGANAPPPVSTVPVLK